MPLLKEAAVYRPDIASFYVDEHEENLFFIASRQSVFNWTRIRPQNARWFFVANESKLWMLEEEEEYIKSLDQVVSFPTPKLGAKSRECIIIERITPPVARDNIRWKLQITNSGLLQTVWNSQVRVNEIFGELVAPNGGKWQVRINNDGLLETALNQSIGNLTAPDGGVWALSVDNNGILQTTKI